MKRRFILAAILVLAALLFSNTAYAQAADNVKLTIIACGKEYGFCAPQITKTFGGYALNDICGVIDLIEKDNETDAVSAEIFFYPERNNKFIITEEKNGKILNTEKLIDDLRDALSVGGGTVLAEFTTVYPTITKSELALKTQLRASFTTYFADVYEMVHNIKLAAKAINGTRLKVGETFSFNKIVGQRTTQRGYLPSKIIYDGKFIDGVGGGVCQAATTLYNAALLSGMTVTERHQHSLAVGYTAKSFDAMVNSYSADLCFKNESGYDVFIEASVLSGSINIKFYGEAQHCVIERESVIREINAPSINLIEDETVKSGERIVELEPRCGYKSEAYLIKKDKQGKIIEKIKISEDAYARVDGVTKIGTKNG